MAQNGIVYVYGDRKTCSLCRKLQPLVDSAVFKTGMAQMGLTIVLADASETPDVFKVVRTKYNREGGAYPKLIVVGSDTKRKGFFVARATYVKPFTAERLVEMVQKLCPDCCDGNCGEPALCPTCGQPLPAKA